MTLDQMRRSRAQALATGWTPERARAEKAADKTAKVFVDDVIDSWGWPFGVSAREFRETLDQIDADTIELHINSPGGDAFEGVAMYHALRQHEARITVVVDGLAASAASLVAMAGDEVAMGVGTQIMIHDVWAYAAGNADLMTDTAARLNSLSDGYAEVYAARTGRPAAEMRQLMRDEVWLNVADAIEQGFADRATTDDGEKAKAKALALAGNPEFGRVRATAKPPAAEPVGSISPTEEVIVAETTNSTLKQVAQRLGITADVDDATVLAALDEALAEGLDESAPQAATIATLDADTAVALSLDAATKATIESLSTEVAALKAEKAADEKREFFDAVSQQGRIKPAERAEYEALYDVAPEQTKALLLARAPGSAVPVAAIGHEGTVPADPAQSDDYWFAGYSTTKEG